MAITGLQFSEQKMIFSGTTVIIFPEKKAVSE
jgi:hypothetical protein